MSDYRVPYDKVNGKYYGHLEGREVEAYSMLQLRYQCSLHLVLKNPDNFQAIYDSIEFVSGS